MRERVSHIHLFIRQQTNPPVHNPVAGANGTHFAEADADDLDLLFR